MAGSMVSKGNNKWELRVSNGYDEQHKQRRFTKTIYATTKKKASIELAAFVLEVTGKLNVDKPVTFKEFVDYWKQKHSCRVGTITMVNYEQMLNDRLLPAFGFKKMDKITDADILRFMQSLSSANMRLDSKNEKKLSSVTIMKHFKLLNIIFNKACAWKYLAKNPCDAVSRDLLIKAESTHYPIWDSETLRKAMKIIDDMPHNLSNQKNRLMFYIALTTGARKGEFLGLTWDRVDLERRELKITKSMKYVNGRKPFLGTPKTDASVRTLYFDDFLKQLFLDYKAQLDEWLTKNKITNPQNLVFVSRNADEQNEAVPINGDSFYLWLKRLCKKHNLPRIAVHSLRAMAATNALISGMSLNMVQAMLGHTNISTTSIYLRDVQDERKKVTNLLSKHFADLRKE